MPLASGVANFSVDKYFLDLIIIGKFIACYEMWNLSSLTKLQRIQKQSPVFVVRDGNNYKILVKVSLRSCLVHKILSRKVPSNSHLLQWEAVQSFICGVSGVIQQFICVLFEWSLHLKTWWGSNYSHRIGKIIALWKKNCLLLVKSNWEYLRFQFFSSESIIKKLTSGDFAIILYLY